MESLSTDETTILQALLYLKLEKIPADHLPALTLIDIVNQTSKALYLPNIPPDLQLPFFLSHRGLIDANRCTALKPSRCQPNFITRAIFFYRLSKTHQFQRFHDDHRWNVAIFVALLSDPSVSFGRYSVDESVTYMTRGARRFIIAYLAAVLEHHNEPTGFEKREMFIEVWKESRYDFFTFLAGHKKLLKNLMKDLNPEWEREIRQMKELVGKGAYERAVAKFVGVLVPGKHEKVQDVIPEEGGCGLAEGALLKALKTPLWTEEVDVNKLKEDADMSTNTVVRLEHAIKVAKRSVPRDILMTLMHLFPADGDESEYQAAVLDDHAEESTFSDRDEVWTDEEDLFAHYPNSTNCSRRARMRFSASS